MFEKRTNLGNTTQNLFALAFNFLDFFLLRALLISPKDLGVVGIACVLLMLVTSGQAN